MDLSPPPNPIFGVLGRRRPRKARAGHGFLWTRDCHGQPWLSLATLGQGLPWPALAVLGRRRPKTPRIGFGGGDMSHQGFPWPALAVSGYCYTGRGQVSTQLCVSRQQYVFSQCPTDIVMQGEVRSPHNCVCSVTVQQILLCRGRSGLHTLVCDQIG